MIVIFRIVFFSSSVILAILYFLSISVKASIIAAVIVAAIALCIIVVVEYISHTVSARFLVASILGLLLGFALGHFMNLAFDSFAVPVVSKYIYIVKPLIYHLTAFALMMLFAINNEEIAFLDRVFPINLENSDSGGTLYKILDTSAIIDGRIADLCDTGFIEGILVIPNFVLHELQMIADSADSIKRNRGRRGLDILNKMQKDMSVKVKISDMDFPDIHEVDAKLVKLGKIMNGKIITNDFNLNKVAEFQGVTALNINQLSNALKPIVLPGEEMSVNLIKEGKDPNQAIAYLDDGTMVVVENGRRKLNEPVEVVVTSVLQTTAGRMIFAKLK
ncbi:MAG: hypothetical protein FWG13_05165 [Leptospirales bacterium]|nr:hypothetical protein [Leptospirales bacterium]